MQQAVERTETNIEILHAAISQTQKAYQLSLANIKMYKSKVEHSQEVFDQVYQQRKSAENHLNLLKEQLNELRQELDGLQKKVADYQQSLVLLRAIEEQLITDDYIGNNWYLPLFKEDNVFEKLAVAMEWGTSVKKHWLEVFNHSQAYQRSHLSSVVTYYVRDGTKTAADSPRKNMLEQVQTRIRTLGLSEAKYIENLTKLEKGAVAAKEAEVNNASPTFKRLYAQEDQLRKELEQYTKLLIHENEQSLLLNQQKNDATLLYELKTIEDKLQSLVQLSQGVNGFSEDATLTAEALSAENKYKNICQCIEKLELFINKLEKQLGESQYYILKSKVSGGTFSRLQHQTIYQDVIKKIELIESLINKKEALLDSYLVLKQNYFIAYQEELKELTLQHEMQQIAFKQELEHRKINLEKYLGDGTSANQGELTRYLTERHTTYFVRDCISSFFAFFFKWPTGYTTEQERRERYINQDVRQALVEFKESGDNSSLKLILDPKYSFFSPRSSNDSNFCFSLAYLVQSMRNEFLTSEQLKEYQTQQQEKVNYWALGCLR